MLDEAKVLLPATVQDGHVVGPYSGVALDEVEDLRVLVAQRARLVLERRRLQDRRRQLLERRGTTWWVAGQKKWYPPRVLDALEVRQDAALVDQALYAFRFEGDNGRGLDDGFRIATQYRKDDRLWSAVIRRERTLMRRYIRPQERFIALVLSPQRDVLRRWSRYRRALRRRRPVKATLFTVFTVVPIILFWIVYRLQESILGGVVKTQRVLADKTVDLPILFKEGARGTREEFSTRSGRRGLLRAMLDETYLTPERRRVLLFLSCMMLLFAYLSAEILIRATYPEALQAKQMTDLLFFYAIGTRTVLPTPFELVLGRAYPVLGFGATVFVSAMGFLVGSWLIFIVGGEANKGMKRLFEKNPAFIRALGWMETHARRYGYVILGFILSIPLMTDTLPLVFFSLLNLRLRWFMVTVLVSSVIRVSIVLLLI